MEHGERVFTVREANEMLSQLRPLIEELRDEWARIKELNFEIQKIREKAMSDAYSPHGVEYVESVSHLTLVMDQVREMGVLVKDFEKGLCDFPYIKEDRVVYLCWQLGEERIDYWHDREVGFGGREPLGGEDR